MGRSVGLTFLNRCRSAGVSFSGDLSRLDFASFSSMSSVDRLDELRSSSSASFGIAGMTVPSSFDGVTGPTASSSRHGAQEQHRRRPVKEVKSGDAGAGQPKGAPVSEAQHRSVSNVHSGTTPSGSSSTIPSASASTSMSGLAGTVPSGFTKFTLGSS